MPPPVTSAVKPEMLKRVEAWSSELVRFEGFEEEDIARVVIVILEGLSKTLQGSC